MNPQNFREVSSFIWSIANLLRGPFKQSQYGRIILPFTVLRRLEQALEPTREAVLETKARLEQEDAIYRQEFPEGLSRDYIDNEYYKASGVNFYNISQFSLSNLGQGDIRANLIEYLHSFSASVREIFERFKFETFIDQLDSSNLLYRIVQEFGVIDLSPDTLDNHEMGLVFEDLIRRFAESSNETAGEHFTPRDIVRLTTSLLFTPDDEALARSGVIRTIYDPTAGTGGFLSSGAEYVNELNPNAHIIPFGQELNPESYAICMADMLIKGQDVANIKYGNTLSDDQLPAERFNYMLANPPFGVEWKGIEAQIKNEHEREGFNGRFGPGVPRVSDGSLLFLLHLVSKMRTPSGNDPGSRIGIILNGSPLFTGGAGSGESEIRRYLLEQDLVEAIIALPNDMFYNTGIATYIWILSNHKPKERKGFVQLINGENCFERMRKSLGSKRNIIPEHYAELLLKEYAEFDKASGVDPVTKAPLSKILATTDFGYRRVTIERPLRLSVALTPERLATLRFSSSRTYNAPMQRIVEYLAELDIPFAGTLFADASSDVASTDVAPESAFSTLDTLPDASELTAEDFAALEQESTLLRGMLKEEFPALKEAQLKTLLAPKLWLEQGALFTKGVAIAREIVASTQAPESDDFNTFTKAFDAALKTLNLKLVKKERDEIINAISWRNPNAAPVIKRQPKRGEANPLYGMFTDAEGNLVEYDTDSELRDTENIPLNPELTTEALVEQYVTAEVLPHVPDAWISRAKAHCDKTDEAVGVVGYEIPFNRHFYIYEPPRDLAEIDAELSTLSREIMALLEAVKSGEQQ